MKRQYLLTDIVTINAINYNVTQKGKTSIVHTFPTMTTDRYSVSIELYSEDYRQLFPSRIIFHVRHARQSPDSSTRSVVFVVIGSLISSISNSPCYIMLFSIVSSFFRTTNCVGRMVFKCTLIELDAYRILLI